MYCILKCLARHFCWLPVFCCIKKWRLHKRSLKRNRKRKSIDRESCPWSICNINTRSSCSRRVNDSQACNSLMWARVWFPSVALSWLWFLYASYPLCSLKRGNTLYIPLAFLSEKKNPLSVMREYCGKLYANLKMCAGLRGFLPLYPNHIVCLAVGS